MTATEHVILVDEHDNPIGTAEKLHAHEAGLRHRAFSVFIVRHAANWEILLQQRAKQKYHSPLLWTNTCCSHPRPGEEIIAAGERRLHEEMGIKTSLRTVGCFHYVAHFDNGLTENELDYVLIGEDNHLPFSPNPEEIHAHRWVSFPELKKEWADAPQQFTPWFMQALTLIEKHLYKTMET